jgi:uncharacterized protein
LIVLDTSVFIAFLRASDRDHGPVAEWLATEPDRLTTTPLCLAEMDRLAGTEGAAALRDNLKSGAVEVHWWPSALEVTLRIAGSRPELGLADASLVALAAHSGTTRIATLDHRHFRSLPPLTGEPAFVLLPADAD